jgi:hypothetical protein
MLHCWRFARQAIFAIFLLASVVPRLLFSQSTQSAPPPQPGQVEDKRVFGVLPNYRTSESSIPFKTLTVKQKFTIFAKDSFDYPVFFTTAFFAGLSQLHGDADEVYGQGMKGYAHRYGISYADQVLGNFFPEAIVPTLFHDDPRYFRMSTGPFKSRLFYALTRMLVGKNDAGHWTFNAPEIIGNSLAATAAMSYHPHQRTLGDAVQQAGSFWEADVVGNIMKEFWPDIKRHFSSKHSKGSSNSSDF